MACFVEFNINRNKQHGGYRPYHSQFYKIAALMKMDIL
jgi:hypothetical protein